MKIIIYAILSLSVTFPTLYAQKQGLPDNYNPLSFSIPKGLIEGTDYTSKKIILKLKPGFENGFSATSNAGIFFQEIGGTGLKKIFQDAKKPNSIYNERGEKLADLSRIYEFTYSSSHSVAEVMKKIKSFGIVEYVQPEFFVKGSGTDGVKFLINDPLINNQWHLNKIGAAAAWDVSTGNPSVIIAVSDGGTNLAHPDLGNVSYNLADPIDGADNDADGWIDNYQGWNTGSDNNNPNYNVGGGANHGVFVCGLAAANTNNGVGTAGTGFNCSYLPIKIVNAANQWTGAEKSLYYAAQKGAHVINASWGDYYPTPYMEDAVRYAAVNMGCLIVSAAGNGAPTPDVPYFPASYEYVMSVAGTDSLDQRFICGASSSQYNEFVDISAPAAFIYSTSLGAYGSGGCGTSYASPIVAGAAGLVKSAFPAFNARQIEALLKEKSTNIDAIPSNVPFAGKLGEGRLNMAAAMAGPSSPYIYMTQRNFLDGNDNQFMAGETVNLTGLFVNYLNTSTGFLNAVLSSSSPYITVTDANSALGAINTLATHNSNGDPFIFNISGACPADETIMFKITYTDGAYTSAQYFSLILNPSYINIPTNLTHTTVCSNGRVGFNDEDLFQGLGISKNGTLNFSTAGSLMIGASSTQVSDAAFGNAVSPFDTDFTSITNAHAVLPSVNSNFDVSGVMNDNGAGASAMNVEVTYNTYAWTAAGFDKFVIFEYIIKNTGPADITNFHAGMFNYFDIPDATFNDVSNMAQYDAVKKMGYAYTSNPGKYAAVKVLTYNPVNYYAFNSDGAGGSINILDGFTSAEKFQAMSNGISRPSSVAGKTSAYIGTGPFVINPTASIKVAFAILTGDNLSDIQSIADTAQIKYDGLSAQWTGAVDTLWENTANWNPPIIPTATTDVLVKSLPNYPVVNSTAQCRDLTVTSGAFVKIHNNHSLSVNRMLTNNGTMAVRTNAGLVQSDASILTGSGSFYVGRTVTNSISTPFHFVGSPMNNLPLSDFANDIGGFGANAFAVFDGINIDVSVCLPLQLTATSPYGNIFQYTEADAVNCNMEGWEVRTTGPAQNGKGFAVIIPNGTTLHLNGTVNNQLLTVGGLTRTATNLTATQGVNQISNPYPSNINWNTFRANNAATIQASAYLYNQGVWVTYDAFTLGQLIGPVQAFQVETAPPPGTYSVNFRNNQRVAGLATFYDDTMPFDQMLNVSVTACGKQDNTKIVFAPNSTDAWDWDFDGRKLRSDNGFHTIYTNGINDTVKYSVNAMPSYSFSTVIPMKLIPGCTGNFHFDFQGLDQFPANVKVLLKDLQQTPPSITEALPGYDFTVTDSSKIYDYEILFEEVHVGIQNTGQHQPNVQLYNIGSEIYFHLNQDTNEDAQLQLIDITGKSVINKAYKNLQKGTYNLNVGNLSSGVYLITLTSKSNRSVKKIVISSH